MIKGIIFDVGGVLAHDVWEHLLLDKPKGLAARFDLQYDAVEKVGKALWTAFDRWRAEPEDEWLDT